MSEYTFKVNTGTIVASDCFKEASKEELRVLISVIAIGSSTVTIDLLSEIAGVSQARTKAALTLFEESGIIEKRECDFPLGEVVYEFEPTKTETDASKTSIEAAKSIRDNNLYELHMECEKLLGKSLSTYEIGNLNSLYTDKGLSPQYILTLTSYLAEVRSSVKISTVARMANELVESGIDTLEDLERYIEEKAKEVRGEMEMRALLGIRGRTLTPTERKYFKRWLHEFCYSVTIIGEAYDICVASTGRLSLKFMDTVLKAWHDAGCKTLDECRTQHEQHQENNKQKTVKTKKTAKKESETPKYSDFDSEDALMRALERSYGDD